MLSKNLEPAKFTSYICSLEKSESLAGDFEKTNVKLFSLGTNKRIDIRVIRRLCFFVTKNRIDIIYSHGTRQDILAVIVGFLIRKPVISFEHGIYSSNKIERGILAYQLFKIIDNILVLFVKKIVCNSEVTAESRKKNLFWMKKKPLLVRFGVEERKPSRSSFEGLKAEVGIAKDDFVLGYIGHFNWRRGHENLVRAISLISPEWRNKIKLLLIGDGQKKEEIRRLVKRLNLEQEIIFLGNREDIGDLFKIMNLYVNPAISESFGIATVEAMLASLPVVVAKAGALPELVEEGKNGFLVKPEDSQVLAEVLMKLISNPQLCKRLGENARKISEQKFSVTSFIERITNLYEEVLT